MRGFQILAMACLCACSTPVPPSLPPAVAGPAGVAIADQSYIADVRPSSYGGFGFAITRDPTPFRYDEGAEAKRQATLVCANRNTVLSPEALGEFDHGAWVFKRGCA